MSAAVTMIRPAPPEQSDAALVAAKRNLRGEYTAALCFGDASTVIQTPGCGDELGGPTSMTFADWFFDEFAGIGSDERRAELIAIFAGVVAGRDMRLRAELFASVLAERYVMAHAEDAAAAMDDDERRGVR